MFFPAWTSGDSCFLPMRHISSTHYSHNPAPPTTQSHGFLWTTTSSCCFNARSSSSNSSSTCCRNTRCCCNTRCCNTLYPANKCKTVKAVILWRRVPTYSCSSPHPGLDIDNIEGKRRCNFVSDSVLRLGLFHEVVASVSSTGRTRARTSYCLRRRNGKGCHRYTHNGDEDSVKHFHTASYSITHPR